MKITELLLLRRWFTKKTTIGELFWLALGGLSRAFECFILEDVVRPPTAEKIFGETAIPYGRYQIKITWSPKFKCDMPILCGVPNYQGIRVHPGNDEGDTLGCLLPGKLRVEDRVLESVAAYKPLFEKLKAACAAGEVWLTIKAAE